MGLEKVALINTNFSSNYPNSNIAKTALQNTTPPLFPNPCYGLGTLVGKKELSFFKKFGMENCIKLSDTHQQNDY